MYTTNNTNDKQKGYITGQFEWRGYSFRLLLSVEI